MLYLECCFKSHPLIVYSYVQCNGQRAWLLCSGPADTVVCDALLWVPVQCLLGCLAVLLLVVTT